MGGDNQQRIRWGTLVDQAERSSTCTVYTSSAKCTWVEPRFLWDERSKETSETCHAYSSLAC